MDHKHEKNNDNLLFEENFTTIDYFNMEQFLESKEKNCWERNKQNLDINDDPNLKEKIKSIFHDHICYKDTAIAYGTIFDQ